LTTMSNLLRPILTLLRADDCNARDEQRLELSDESIFERRIDFTDSRMSC
jgi:hypothetical protein